LFCYALNTLKEAFKSDESKEWLKTMNEEIHSFDKDQAWKHLGLPRNQRVVGLCRSSKRNKVLWEFKIQGTNQGL